MLKSKIQNQSRPLSKIPQPKKESKNLNPVLIGNGHNGVYLLRN